MDTRKTLQTLLKIAQNQQKMIEKQQKQIDKLAQLSSQQLSPMRLEPVRPQLHGGDLVLSHLPKNVQDSVETIMAHDASKEMRVKFKPGHTSPGAFNAIVQTVQKLVSSNQLPFAYTVKVV